MLPRRWFRVVLLTGWMAAAGVPGAWAASRVLVAGGADSEVVLPPLMPWNGASLSLMLPPEDPWATPFEKSAGLESPGYDDTVRWLERLVKEAPELALVSLGKSPQGRDIWMVVASADGAFTPEALHRAGKPVLLAQAGIHPGEIDGKDAGMMLLRDMTARGTKRALLDRASFLFVPIFNVDGHERSSRYGRINQRGPRITGWRTNARNLNLNRDYGKLDTPEMRAMVAALRAWKPDLYLDIHVTDGVDYQYDITWGYNGPHAFSPDIAAWLDREFTPALEKDLRAMGHVPGPLVFAVDDADMSKGIVDWTAGLPFSNGYGDARHLATILVENHSLKPFRRRVLGTYVFLEGALRVLGERGRELRRAAAEDEKIRRREIPLQWKTPEGPPPTIEFLGIRSRLVPSAVSGGLRVEWTGEPVTIEIPRIAYTEPAVTVTRPKAYWIPASWPEIIERLERHGIRVERIREPRELDVVMYRIEDARMDSRPREGRPQVRGTPVREERREWFPAGSARVDMDQPLGDLAALLLEPASSSSFFRWGFFLEVLQRTEYAEGYVMDPTASRMLADDPDLAREFTTKLREDPDFAHNPAERLQWFYRRTPYFDQRWRLYPVAREE